MKRKTQMTKGSTFITLLTIVFALSLTICGGVCIFADDSEEAVSFSEDTLIESETEQYQENEEIVFEDHEEEQQVSDDEDAADFIDLEEITTEQSDEIDNLSDGIDSTADIIDDSIFVNDIADENPSYANVSVNLDAKGGKFADGRGSKQDNPDENETIAMLERPERDGFIFNGWTYNGSQVDPDTPIKDLFPGIYSITLDAEWEDAVKIEIYRTKYDLYDTKTEKKGYVFRDDYFEDMIRPNGKVFVGWSLMTPDGPLLTWQNEIRGLLRIEEDVKLYAVWKDAVKIRVHCTEGKFPDSYESIDGEWTNGANETSQIRLVEKGAPFDDWNQWVISSPEKKLFKGWSLTQDGAPLEWQAGINGFFIADQDIDLYAVWIDAVEIKFYCTEGKPIDDAQGPDGDSLIDEFGDAYYRRIVEKGYWLEGRGGGDMTPPPGKILAGWSLTRGGEPLEWRDDIVGILVVNENTNLYAVWGDPVEIRLNCTEGKHTDGYEDSDGNWIRKETSEPCISRIVLKGSSFSEGGGDMIPPVGKVFAGWSLTPDGEPLEWQDDIPGYFIANDSIDLYAKWTAAVEMTFVAVNNTFDKDKQDREGFIPLNDSYTVVKKYYDVKGVFDWCAFPEDYEKHFVGKDEDTTFLGWYRDSSGKSRLEYDDSIGGFFRFTNDDLQNGITLYGIWQRDDFAIKSNNNDEISVWVDRDKLEPVITAAYSNAVNQALQDASVVNVQTEVYLDSRRTINQDKTIDFHITPYIQLMAFDAGNNKSPIGNQMILSNSLINGITFYINLVLPAADYPVGIPVKVEHKDNNGNLKNTFYCVARALSKDDNGNVTETSVTVVTDSFSVFTASVATYRDVPVTLGTDVKSVTVTADGISKIVNKTDTIKSFHLPVDAVITITATVENGYTAVINPAGPVRVDKIPAAGITVNAKKKESYVPSLYYLTLASSDGAKTKPSCSKDITTGYSSGTQMTVTASEPNDGYVFDGWYEGNTKKSDSRTYSFKLNNNTTLTAKYKKVVTIVADNDSVAVGEKVKLGKTSILGLNNSDVNSIVDISGLTLTCSYTEKAQVGDTFAIIPSGAVLKDNQYVLEYRDGLLTVIRGQAVDTFLANDLPAVENVRIADREKVEKGKADYAKLSDTQKSLPEVVSAKEKLDTVEKALKAAEEKATSDQDAANAVIQLVKALPEKPTIEDKEKVKTAENAYVKLSNDQKAYISEADKGKLVSAVKVIDEAEKEKAADDKVKADVVKKLIDQLPDVAVPEKSVAVNAVYKQYIALTNGQKALIPKAEKEKLEALRKALDGEDQDAAGETVVEKFTEAVNAVPGSKAGTGKGLLDEATAIYTTMTEAQKALVSSETMSLYYEAGTAFKKDRKFKSGDAYYKVLSNGDVTYLKPASKEITKVTVPNQVKKGKFLFKVIKVSSNAFRNCNNLGWAVIGKNVRVFGEYVFARTYNLSKVKVLGTGFKSGKITNAFVKAGKNGRLIVKVPGSKVNEYQKLFTGEGRLKGSVTAA